MHVWCRDSDNRLVRIESNNLFGNLSDFFTHSHTLDIMVDLESVGAFFGGIGLPPAVMGWVASCDDRP